MKKMKKIAFGTLAALSTVAIPMVAVVSCGGKEVKTFTVHGEDDGSIWTFIEEHTKKDGILDQDFDVKFGGHLVHFKKGETEEEIDKKLRASFHKYVQP